MLLASDEGGTDGLGVVRRGGEAKDLLDDVLDTAVRDGRGALETVDSAAVSGGIEPVVGRDLVGRHFDVDCE